MAIRVRTCRDLEEFRAAVGAIGHYFGWLPTDEDAERMSRLLPVDRMHVALDGASIVAGAGTLPFELMAPGASVACAGVTAVGVLPTHRRRGVLRRMMEAQLEQVRQVGEPISALWASDEQIYGRYGYGLASLSLKLKVPRTWAQLRPDAPGRSGSLRLVDHDEALRVFPRIYDRVRALSPGFVSRSRVWWEQRILADRESNRRGAGPLNRALLEVGGRPAGYALYRVRRNFGGAFEGSVNVQEALGVDAAATRDVWRFLLEIDWMDEITAWMLSVDHPLVLQAARINRLGLELMDGLWVRLMDVGAALSARGYARDGRVTLEVTDPIFGDNVGVWTVDGGVARRTARRPDVRLSVQHLGAAYLGGFSFAELARAELAEEASRGGLARADALFGSDRAPWCPENF
jgi:predicted acetyltransferase